MMEAKHDDIGLHRGWHRRGYLPHRDDPGIVQAVTFRLADSLPQQLIEPWSDSLLRMKPSDARVARMRYVAEALDTNLGRCWLQRPEIAQMIEAALLHFDGTRYRLLAWCIMPNHVHALIAMFDGMPLDQIIHSWKSFTARECNRLLGRSGALWARDYYDRYIRDDDHLTIAAAYIESNPVKAHLMESPEQWRWSSAWHRANTA
ncbi:MAG: REP-associated tyrosine transposase [Chloroflexota bacterium]